LLGFALGRVHQFPQPRRDVESGSTACAEPVTFGSWSSSSVSRRWTVSRPRIRFGKDRLREAILLFDQREEQMLNIQLLLAAPNGH
jgi:hypothetical protein